MIKKHYLIISFSLITLFSILFFYLFKTNNKVESVVKPSLTSDKNIVQESNYSTEILEELDPAVIEPINQPLEVILSSVGDVTIGTDDNFTKGTSLPVVYKKSNDPEYLFKNAVHIFKQDDITTANLETTFTTTNTKREKKFNFKGDPSLANALLSANIEAVNISNNHIYDYGQQGFDDTIKTLKDRKINYFGENTKWVTTINGIKFGFLGYQGWNNDKKLFSQMKKDISALKDENCVVIINFHWGEERKYTPNNTQRNLAHYAIDNGADLIIGHHPHVIQGIEQYKDKFIAYSLGNFCFGGNSNPSDKDTFILQNKFKFMDGKLISIGIRVIPFSISSVSYKNDYQPTPLNGSEKSQFLIKLNKLNINLKTDLGEDFFFINR